MPLLQHGEPEVVNSSPVARVERRQRRQMLIALALLLIALILVLVKDRQFWFPSSTADSDQVEQDATESRTHAQSVTPQPVKPVQKPKSLSEPAASAAPPDNPAPVISRAALPPLEVEVVAGNQRRTIPTQNPSIKVDIQPGTTSATASAATAQPEVDASEHVRMSPQTVQVVSRPVEPAYPVLAKQMKVQGSVVLQALIGKDGLIQSLQVMSGPAILSAAAREAVKQWRFKPYYQNGAPVDTEARITVNFTISTN
jgi:protein TonB